MDRIAKRKWSDAYLLLTQATAATPDEPFQSDCKGRVVNWIGAQSVPELLPPYFAGATRSELLTMLEEGHKGVKLRAKNWRRLRAGLICWCLIAVTTARPTPGRRRR